MSIVFHNQSKYDYHFVIKELPEEFEGQFGCLGENTEKKKCCKDTKRVPIEKEIPTIDTNGKEITRTISCRLQFIDSERFMASSLSCLGDNIAEGIRKLKCKYRNTDKMIKCEICGIKHKDGDCFLEYTNFRDDLVEYKCLCCGKNYQKQFDENFEKRFLTNFLTMISTRLFYCCKRVFIHTNTRMVGKNFV